MRLLATNMQRWCGRPAGVKCVGTVGGGKPWLIDVECRRPLDHAGHCMAHDAAWPMSGAWDDPPGLESYPKEYARAE